MVLQCLRCHIHIFNSNLDPAIVYNPALDRFERLNEDGLALGIDCRYAFEEYRPSDISDGRVIAIGTDGIWKTENTHGEKFGRARRRRIIRQHSRFSSQEILKAITDVLAAFRGKTPQEDNVTLVVVKPQNIVNEIGSNFICSI